MIHLINAKFPQIITLPKSESYIIFKLRITYTEIRIILFHLVHSGLMVMFSTHLVLNVVTAQEGLV